MKIKTSELVGAALNWAVAQCENRNVTLMRNSDGSLFPQPVWANGIEQLNYSTFGHKVGRSLSGRVLDSSATARPQ